MVGVSRRENPVTTYLSDEEKADLVRWSNKTEKSQAHLLREAVLEYLDHDRTARIESEVRELQEKVDDILVSLDNDDTHTHKGVSDALQTAREIIRVIQRNTDNPDDIIKTDELVRYIEDYAGVDDRTIRKYKDIFRRRGLLFEHPGDAPLWTLQTNVWSDWAIQYANLNGGRGAAEDVIEDYPAAILTDGDSYEIEIESEVTDR